MALFGHPEYQIGRGEVSESFLEAPIFVLFLMLNGAVMIAFYLVTKNASYTVAVGVTLFVFSSTLIKVELGVAFLVVAMGLSPEIDAGPVGLGTRSMNLRYDDFLIFVVFMGVLVRQAWEGKPFSWKPSPINMGIVAYYGMCLVSSLRAYRVSLAYWDKYAAFFILVKMVEFYMIFFLVGNAIKNMKSAKYQIVVFFVVSLIISTYALRSVGITSRVSAPFEAGGTEPNTLGGYLTICMVLAIAILTQTRSWKVTISMIVLFGYTLIPFLYTLSRASYLALVAGLLTLGFMSRRYWIIVLMVLVLMFSSALMPEEVCQRVNYTFQEGAGEHVVIAGKATGIQVDKSTYERIYVWQKVKHNLRIWPWIGGGVGWSNIMDSQYARVLIETGILGLIAFLFMQFQLMKTGRQAYRWSDDTFGKALGLATVSCTIALMVHSAGTISFLIVRIMEPYWFIVALAVTARMNAVEDYTRTRKAELAAREEAMEETPDEEEMTPAHVL